MKNAHVIMVNNTATDISMFDAVLLDCIGNRKPLPEELADVLTLEIIEADGKVRGIVSAA